MPRPRRYLFAQALSCSFLFVGLLGLTGCQLMSGHAANNLGSTYYREGNYAAARHSFQQALADMPENPDFRYNLAAAMHKQGDVANAEQVYRQALRIDPAHQPSYHGLAELLAQQGRPAEATNLMNTWVATQPYSPKAHIEMAWLQQQQGNQTAAAQSLETALKLQPNNPVAMAQLGQVYEASGQRDLAVAYYQRSLQSNWRQPDVQTRLAQLAPNRSMPQPNQIAFGFQPAMPAATQMAWQQPQFANTPTTMATIPPGTLAQPTMTVAAPLGSPQVQTAYLPPEMAMQNLQAIPSQMMQSPVMGQPTPIGLPVEQFQQPIPVGFSPAQPQPTFANVPMNADPAHIPEMTAELPVVQPY